MAHRNRGSLKLASLNHADRLASSHWLTSKIKRTLKKSACRPLLSILFLYSGSSLGNGFIIILARSILEQNQTQVGPMGFLYGIALNTHVFYYSPLNQWNPSEKKITFYSLRSSFKNISKYLTESSRLTTYKLSHCWTSPFPFFNLYWARYF